MGICFCARYRNTPLRVMATAAAAIHNQRNGPPKPASFMPTGQPTSHTAAMNRYTQDTGCYAVECYRQRCDTPGRLAQQAFPVGDAAGGVDRVGGTGVGAQREGAVQIKDGVNILTVLGGDSAELLQRELIKRGAAAHGHSHGFAHQLMCMAERYAAAHQVVCQIRSQQQGVCYGGGALIFVNAHGGNHLSIDTQSQGDGFEGVEEGLFVLLQVSVVGKGQAFYRHHHAHKVAV